MLRFRTLFVAVLLVLAAGAAARAAAPEGIAAYLADDVVAIASADCTRIDIVAAFETFVKLGVVPGQWIEQERATATAAQKGYAELPRRGAKRIFALLRTSDVVHRGTSWVVELADGSEARAVASLLKEWTEKARRERSFGDLSNALPTEFEAAGNVVLAASSAAQLAALKETRTTTPRDVALAAVTEVLASDVGLVAFGDPDSRRVVREMFPALPAPFMEIDGRLLADGVKWLGVQVKLPPTPSISVSLEATGPESAATLEQSAIKAAALAKGAVMAAMLSGPNEMKVVASAALPLVSALAPRRDGARLTLSASIDQAQLDAMGAMLRPLASEARESANRAQRMNNFKQLALAMHNYHDAKGSFPPAASHDAAGKPLLSWRVLILPYMEEQALYAKFHLDEPWDSEHNRTLIDKMPVVFDEPQLTAGGPRFASRTTTVVPTGPGTAFDGVEGTKIKNITDGLSHTILMVQAAPERAVVWTKPDDWDVDFNDPLRWVKRGGAGGAGGVFAAAYCDGSVRMIKDDIEPKTLAGLITIAGEENVAP